MEVKANASLSEARGRLFSLRVGAILELTALVTLLYASGTRAETFTVTNTNNSGVGSLRAAIKGANYSA